MQVENVEEQKACANALRRIQSNRRAKMPETLKAPSNVKLKTKSSSSIVPMTKTGKKIFVQSSQSG